jgi:predicted DNA-binding transcriptional regulator AlpA
MQNCFEEWITNKQVAGLLGVTTRTVFSWSADPILGFPAPCKINNRRYFPRAEIESWRASRRIGAAPTPAAEPTTRGIMAPIPRARRKAGSLIDRANASELEAR